jgi:hypothetical protein
MLVLDQGTQDKLVTLTLVAVAEQVFTPVLVLVVVSAADREL